MGKRFWMVRAGRGSAYVDDFEEHSCVAIGWGDLGDLSNIKTRKEVTELGNKIYADEKLPRRRAHAGQVANFLFELKQGDRVITYNGERRIYLVGRVTGDYQYLPDLIPPLPNVRRVTWDGTVNRDDLSVPTLNTLGATMTIFRPSSEAASEIEERLAGKPPKEEDDKTPNEEIEVLLKENVERGREFIKDRMSKLDWEEMEYLVAGCLRAMGYKTRISPRGSDRGRDITASPDGLGLEQPRIVVEVKHRHREQIGAPQLRSFLGGRHPQDKCLYVSTGGFSKEARYEADRSSIPITLLDLDDLVDLVLQHYETMDTDSRALLPLLKFYWPAP